MSHECPECGHGCYCDNDDLRWEDAPDNCRHRCLPNDENDDGPYVSEESEPDTSSRPSA